MLHQVGVSFDSPSYVGSVWTEQRELTKVYEWVEMFKSGRTRVTDEGRSGRPSTSRSRKASSPQECRNQLNDITNALCCKADCVEKKYVKLLTVTAIKAVKCILLYFSILPRKIMNQNEGNTLRMNTLEVCTYI